MEDTGETIGISHESQSTYQADPSNDPKLCVVLQLDSYQFGFVGGALDSVGLAR
jgi:hypothetical protein